MSKYTIVLYIKENGESPIRKFIDSLDFFVHANTIVLTNGFIKKSNKTPKREIELAQNYRRDYFDRLGE